MNDIFEELRNFSMLLPADWMFEVKAAGNAVDCWLVGPSEKRIMSSNDLGMLVRLAHTENVIVTIPRVGEGESFVEGDYVFACKYSDCGPSDGWAVGTVGWIDAEKGIINVVDSEGDNIGRRYFKCAIKVTEEQAKRILGEYPGWEGHSDIPPAEKSRIFFGDESPFNDSP